MEGMAMKTLLFYLVNGFERQFFELHDSYDMYALHCKLQKVPLK